LAIKRVDARNDRPTQATGAALVMPSLSLGLQ
jgi:hypothetical protein